MQNISVIIDGLELDIDSSSDFPITIDYQLEDSQDFQEKKSSQSIGLTLPATLNNQKILNTFHNPSVNDLTKEAIYTNIRQISMETDGFEIFVGKAIPKKAIKKGGIPILYEMNCFGNNADWIIDLKELTLYDILKHIEFTFNENTIINSWQFDGQNANLPYVFAPVKYGEWMDPDYNNGEGKPKGSDKNYSIKTMRPSLSLYWIFYWGFKSIGYKIKSEFFNTNYFKRLVIPWSFGGFLTSENTKYEIHKFLARTNGEEKWFDYRGSNFVDLDVKDNLDGCYDNNNTLVSGDYTGSNGAINGGGTEMIWKYNPPHYGPLEVMMKMSLYYDYLLQDNNPVESTDMSLDLYWYHKDASTGVITEFIEHIRDDEITTGQKQESGLRDIYRMFTVNPNDEIICKVWLRLFPGKGSNQCRCKLRVDEYTTDYFRIPVGGNISFDAYLSLQKENFLDVVRGTADLFNLSIQTDPVNKEVLIEPTHSYSITNNKNQLLEGYFTDNILNWGEKEDISQESTLELYDDNAREYVFKFKEDSNDGALKVVQDRYKITIGSGKYVFNKRFKAEKKEFENRYFSPTMHYLVDDFQGITGIAPQMICLVPENISNTSSSEAQNTFNPKIAYYKGLVLGAGGWIFNGKTYMNYPYLFSVNYKPGGENDPILSYTDEKIGNNGNFKIGRGLLKRFFWQRLAIMNNGQWLTTNFELNNTDIINWYHRERIALDGELWELLSIKGYSSIKGESTECVLRKWVPITQREDDNTYPSEKSILTDAVKVDQEITSSSTEIDKVFDNQYSRAICLYKDIPR